MDSPLRQGARLGRYRLLTELGHGGMASVWVALEQTPSGAQRFVALKVMLPRLASQSSFRAMFLDEGQLVRSIEHPNVVRVFEVGEDRGMLYMAMEWVEGDSLHQVIRAARKRRAIPPEMAVRIIADVAAGLHEAHELRGWDGELRGVVHCDVSPQNILIGIDGQPKLVDFGVAHAAALSDDDRGQVRGKLGYMSPEQAYARPLDRRSDVFSLGIVLFELTTGKRLFGRKDPQQTLSLVRSARVPIPTSVWSEYPETLGHVVLKALQRDPRHRFQTALEFKEALERFLIDTRTMVPRVGVASLLSRVLGDRIRERRAEVQAALDDVQESAIALPEQELASYDSNEVPDEATTDGDGLFEVDNASVSLVTASRGSSLRSVMPHVVESQSLGPPRRTGWLVAAAILCAVVAGTIVYVWPSSSTPEASANANVSKPSEPTPSKPLKPSTASSEVPTADGIALDSIPITADAPQPPPKVPSPATASPSARQPAPERDKPPVEEASPSKTKKRAPPSDDLSTDFLDDPKGRADKKPGDDLDISNPYR